MPDHHKRQLFFKALSSQQRNAIGCQKLEGTCKSLIQAFRQVDDVSHFDSFTELRNIRMREGELITAFANRYQALLPSGFDPNNDYSMQDFICKFLIEVQTQLGHSSLSDKKGQNSSGSGMPTTVGGHPH